MVIKIAMDNGFNEVDGMTVAAVPESVMDSELRSFFGWRTPTKQYESLRKRYYALGTSQHDAFIGDQISKGRGYDSRQYTAEQHGYDNYDDFISA